MAPELGSSSVAGQTAERGIESLLSVRASARGTLDCVIVGYHDIDFADTLRMMEPMQKTSGAYRNILNNTVHLRGRRMTYMHLMSAAIEEATGTHPSLNVAQLPSLGVCYLRSFLARRGLSVDSVNFFTDQRDELEALLRRGPRVVAITTTFYVDDRPIREIVDFVRRRVEGALIVVGGPHVQHILSLDPEVQDYLLAQQGADVYVADAQGEATLCRVVETLRRDPAADLSEIPNLVVRRRDATGGPAAAATPSRARAVSLLRTPRVPENNDLDENSIDWSLFDRNLFAPTVQMRTARSCAFSCSFCKYPIIAGPLAHMSIDAVEREMRQLHAAGIRQLVFVDDTFNVPFPRFKKILAMMIANRFDFRWFSFFRCTNCDEEGFDLMQASGCVGVFLGIESGDQSILSVMNKSARVDAYRQGIASLKARGIMTFASLIVGFPGETRDTVDNTIRFIDETQPTFYRAEIYFHDPTVPLASRSDSFGLRGGGYSWRHDTMTWREACDMVDRIYTTVRGSTILPLYMFDFWSIPYLMGKGVSLAAVQAFAKLCQPLLVANCRGEAADASDLAERTWRDLVHWAATDVRAPVPDGPPAAKEAAHG
jgi:radical SAM PhpK family P-methyltransferase